jgi:pimeloyl-ACP methyl ester carboxylesterase
MCGVNVRPPRAPFPGFAEICYSTHVGGARPGAGLGGDGSVAVQWQYYSEGPAGGPLILILHGLAKRPADMESVARSAREAIGQASTYVPRLAFANPMSLAAPEAIAADLLDDVDELMTTKGHRQLILVGHSMGSVIARKVAVLAHGETHDAPFEPGLERHCAGKSWAGALSRVVLLAGFARGWRTTSANSWAQSALWATLAFIGDLAVNGRWTALRLRLGSPFMVQTRLQWLALPEIRKAHMLVVQLLGSRDDMVAPDDTIDIAVDLPEKGFILGDLPDTDHMAAMRMDGDAAADARRERFQAFLTQSADTLIARRYTIPAVVAANGPPPQAEPEVKDVVFVVHGIRDRGFWTQKVARAVMAAAPAGDPVRAMTASYGYLAMGPFVLPWVRREKVRWLMDQYAGSRARYPLARFHYVGHSNGTYLVARALRDYPAARFERVVLAGSVVRCDYDWIDTIDRRGQVRELMNYVASADWVVAIFSHGFTPFRVFDLGGAGHRGFAHLGPARSPFRQPRVSSVAVGSGTSHQIYYVRGGHGAGIQETQWDEIADFIMNGKAPAAPNADFIGSQTWWVSVCGGIPPLTLLLIVAAVLGLVALACGLAFATNVWLGFGTLIVSFLVLRTFLTRF